MKKVYARLLLLVFLGLLAIQYKLSMMNIEPYPTVMYPEFSYLLPTSDSIAINKPDFVVHYDNGEKEKLDYYQLFSNVPISHVNHIVVNNINPKQRIRPEQFQGKPFKEIQLGRSTLQWRRSPNSYTKEDFRQRDEFLKKRITAVTGRTDIESLLVTWYIYDFYYGKGRDFENRRKNYETHFSLDGEEAT